MSVGYAAVGWNRQKRLYDTWLAGGVAGYLLVFAAVSALFPGHDAATIMIRGLGSCALVLLHVVLWIGPLARLDRRLLPLLYNRRHMGVTMFALAAGHGLLAMVQYHGFGNVNPLVSLLTGNRNFLSLTAFPFELPGAVALLVLLCMAVTSHDFWLANLSARVWKWLHMGVYGAYAMLVAHVVLGVLQQERNPVLAVVLCAGVVVTCGLHLLAARVEAKTDAGTPTGAKTGEGIDIGSVMDIPLDRAKVVCFAKSEGAGVERVAVFKYVKDGQCRVSAVANVCAHQQGPLGEGKIGSDGCITCPWHGYQYRPGDGCAPPPFTEKIATYRVTLRGERVLVDPRPLPPGTPVAPAVVTGAAPAGPAGPRTDAGAEGVRRG
jgi:DMSO/TMAO reductase YedYZ heme-binding membrane subunit/nitrite reductase/ring-hydroxylating ferredoxin subunit